MAREKGKKEAVYGVLGLCLLGVFLWIKYREENPSYTHEHTRTEEAGDTEFSDFSPVVLSSGKFETLENCTLINHRNNDGDSFHVSTPNNGRKEFRLYYVDAPESRLHKYNGKRIAEQGRAMGGLSEQQTIQIGKQAKSLTLQLLKGKKFTVSTMWENVYTPERKYAFVIVDWRGEERYLHEVLLAHGLARIHTKPMSLPDNTSVSRHRAKLRKIETHAKKSRLGAWAH